MPPARHGPRIVSRQLRVTAWSADLAEPVDALQPGQSRIEPLRQAGQGSPAGRVPSTARSPRTSPLTVRLADGTEVDDERTDEFSYGDRSVLAGLLPRSGSRSCA
ncbi:hypothetical protein Gobs_1404 [Geodermatophilus obscurus DSM 43160]|uniref:Uncharacterized protein n=1 Tax=Geodermatophilus obscurus (strain ATCC 25078 / DSM 43160 / JCM 3152 / CCUG 61914 / KCC A-0152 / KCTC 9177 / NBRC 13315 / NRRL B-3577 / G-20) TaxID=526225 RepID=D2SBW9_GEOOG|nr:hypothetical protein Gobs_1404 [Geodermatophilus obscurus DSM 43160]